MNQWFNTMNQQLDKLVALKKPIDIIQASNLVLQLQVQILFLTQSLKQNLYIAYEWFCKHKQQKCKQLSAHLAIPAAVISFKTNNAFYPNVFNSVVVSKVMKAETKESCITKDCVQGQYSYIHLTESSWRNHIHTENTYISNPTRELQLQHPYL